VGLIVGLTDPLTDRFRAIHHPISARATLLSLAEGNLSWFLITLFVCMMFALAIYRLPRWLQVVLALTAAYAVPDTGITILFQPFEFFPFVLAGMWLGAGRLKLIETLPRWAAWAGFTSLLAIQAGTIWLFGETTRWDKLPIGLVGSAMLILFCRAIEGSWMSKLFVWFGEASLAIFLLSPFCQGFARELVLHFLHTTAPSRSCSFPRSSLPCFRLCFGCPKAAPYPVDVPLAQPRSPRMNSPRGTSYSLTLIFRLSRQAGYPCPFKAGLW